MRRMLALVLVPMAAAGAEPTGTAVEWYNATLGHYFVTSGPEEIRSVDSGGAGPGWGWDPWGGSRNVQGQTSTIPVGILLMDLYDTGKKQLVWRGDAVKTIDLKKDPDKNYKNLQKLMAKLFKNYPPTPGK